MESPIFRVGRVVTLSLMAALATTKSVPAETQSLLHAPGRSGDTCSTDRDWRPPPPGTKWLFRNVHASLDDHGEIVFSGESLLPPGIVIGATLYKAGRFVRDGGGFTVQEDGSFQTESFRKIGIEWRSGHIYWPTETYHLRLYTSFDADSGVDLCAEELPFSSTQPMDPEFPTGSARAIDQFYSVRVP